MRRFREVITGKTLLTNASVFAQALRSWNDDQPQLTLGIYEPGQVTRQLFQLELDRDTATKIIRELTAALAVQPYTPEEIAHHEAVVASRKEEGASL